MILEKTLSICERAGKEKKNSHILSQRFLKPLLIICHADIELIERSLYGKRVGHSALGEGRGIDSDWCVHGSNALTFGAQHGQTITKRPVNCRRINEIGLFLRGAWRVCWVFHNGFFWLLFSKMLVIVEKRKETVR